MIYNVPIEELRKIILCGSLLNIYLEILITLPELKFRFFCRNLSKSKVLILNQNDIPNRKSK